MRPYLKKTLHKKGLVLVEWPKVQALSSKPQVTHQKKKKEEERRRRMKFGRL
jgi:tRNA A37 threonylcarbamoyladenosine biosynthesis protein TsaE